MPEREYPLFTGLLRVFVARREVQDKLRRALSVPKTEIFGVMKGPLVKIRPAPLAAEPILLHLNSKKPAIGLCVLAMPNHQSATDPA